MTESTDQPEAPALDQATERGIAVDLFNHVWDLLRVENPTRQQRDALVHAAHASRWHWGNAGGPQEWAVGEWQCSRVYAVLGRGEPALHHAQRCLELSAEDGVDSWVAASAHEALARAYAVAGDHDTSVRHRDQAAALAAALDDPDDREVVEADLATLPGRAM